MIRFVEISFMQDGKTCIALSGNEGLLNPAGSNGLAFL